ncbi:carbonic anhydrase 9 isoform X2 [Elgaria multicarinata webbii]|uniref:carbonic anhydrase 9 isoform X2 n=1 Tax=Elgaria multicarinata webbii TaxID=159646 RepID=UPI002FCCDDBC
MRTVEALRLRLLLAALQACAYAYADQEHAGHFHAGHPGHRRDHWSYKGKTVWPSAFPSCGGHMQSPINIDTAATHFSPQLMPLLLSGYSLPPGETLRLHNNGHTIVLDLPGNMMLTGGGFPQPYQAAQLHLHWGSDHSMPGSEHTVDGHRYAGEIHVVHYSSHFSHITEAEREPGGLAVLAAFLEVGPEENEPYQHILEHLEDVHEEGNETLIAGFDVATLLPNNLDHYFRYNGSLTTPPCYQTVNWTIFNQTIRLSQEQIAVLDDALQGDDDQPLQSNYRLPQRMHGRSVLASFQMLHTPEEASPPDEEDPPRISVPRGPTERSDGPDPREGSRRHSSIPDGATGQDSDGPASQEGAGKRVGSSLRTGDVLAVLFGALFGVTALAFLLYVRKHRSQKRRLGDQANKSSAIYTAATTDENTV